MCIRDRCNIWIYFLLLLTQVDFFGTTFYFLESRKFSHCFYFLKSRIFGMYFYSLESSKVIYFWQHWFSVICGYSVLKDSNVYRAALSWEVEAVYYASVSLLLNVSFFVAFVVGVFNRRAYDVCSWVVTFVSIVEFCHAFQSVDKCCGFSRNLRSFEIRFDFESNFRFGIRFVMMIRFEIFESSAPSIVLCKEMISGG